MAKTQNSRPLSTHRHQLQCADWRLLRQCRHRDGLTHTGRCVTTRRINLGEERVPKNGHPSETNRSGHDVRQRATAQFSASRLDAGFDNLH